MKVKKLVSLLLAVMLIVGMVPMNAMADESGATQWGTLDGGKAQGKISLMASTSAPTWTDSEDAGDVYPKKTTTDGAGKTIADEDEIAEYIVSANSWENVSGTTLNVEKGHTFYLGLKFSGENLDKGTDGQNTVTYKGITSAQALIQIDSNVVKLAEGDTQKNNFAAYMKINDIDTGNVLNKTLLSKTGSNYNFVDSAKKVTDGNFKTYMQDKYGTSVNAGSGVAADSDSSILVGIKGQNKGYAVASQAKWDIIIPLKIDGNTTETTTTISLQTKRGESNTYIEFTDKEQDNNTQVNPTGTNGPNYKKTAQDILVENNGTITINIVSKTDSPVNPGDLPDDVDSENPGEIYNGSISNVKNLPYATDASAAANANHGPNDYITFPEKGSSFVLGDQIYIFADAAGTTELGHTTLKAENFYKTDASGNVVMNESGNATMCTTDDFTETTTDEEGKTLYPVSGKTLRLALNDEDGYGYLKNHKYVYIGRLKAADQGGDHDIVGANLVKVEITPEDPVYYDGNVAVANESAPGSESNPIKVTLGDRITGVLAKVDNLPTNVTAPVEGNQTIDTTVDWEGTLTCANADDGKFNVHGVTTIVAPFKNAEFSSNGTVYQSKVTQPTAMVGEDTAPVYGSVLYVEVEPKSSDYIVTKNDQGGGKFGVTGASKAALDELAKKAGATNFVIDLYTSSQAAENNKSNASANNDYFARFNSTAGDTIEDSKLNGVEVGGKVYAVVKDASTNPVSYIGPIEITVVESGKLSVSGFKLNATPDENGEYLIDTATTVEEIFESMDPVFTINGEKDDKLYNEEIHLMDLYKQGEGGTYTSAFDNTKVSVIGDNAWNIDTSNNGDRYDALLPMEDVYASSIVFRYEIPSNAGDLYVAKDDPTTADAETVAQPTYTALDAYDNNKNVTVTFNAKQIARKTLMADPSNGFKTHIFQNDPNGARATKTNENLATDLENWDLFILQGDTRRYNYVQKNSEDDAKNNPALVQVGDPVYVYTEGKSNPMTQGYVYNLIENNNVNNDGHNGAQDTTTYFIKVAQLGRTIDTSKLSLMIGVQGEAANQTLASNKIKFTTETAAPKETYTLGEVKQPSPDVISVDNTEGVYTDVASVRAKAPTTATVEYYYYTEDGKGDRDASTVKTAEYDLPSDADWADDATAVTDYDGTEETSYTVNLDGDVEIGDDLVRAKNYNNTLKVKFDVADVTYDNGVRTTIEEVAATLTANNNRFPEVDTVAVSNLNVSFKTVNEPAEQDGEVTETHAKQLSIYVYDNETNATNNTGAIATITLDEGETVSTAEAVKLSSHLNADGNDDDHKLWVRAKGNGTTLSEKEEVSYSPEDYTLWNVTDTSDKKNISVDRNRDQVNEKSTDAEKVTFLTDALPNTFIVTATRFKQDGNSVVADASTQKRFVVALTEENCSEWTIVGGDPISKENLSTVIGSSGNKTTNLTRTLNEADAATMSIAKVTGSINDQKIVSVHVKADCPTDPTTKALVTRTGDNSLTITATLNVTDNQDDAVFDVPQSYGENHIEADRHEELDFTDDTVTFDFSQTLDGAETTEAKSKMAGANFKFTVSAMNEDHSSNEKQEPITVTGTIGEDGKATVSVGEGSTFKGFPTDCNSILVTFTKEGKTSDPITVPVDPMGANKAVAIDGTNVKITTPISIEMTTGTILKNKDLLDLVTGGDGWSDKITQVTVGTEEENKEVGLVENGGNIDWKLWVGPKGTAPKLDDGYTVTASTESGVDSYVKTLSSVDSTKDYALVTEITEINLKNAGFKYDSVEGVEQKYLAKVDILLYDRHISDNIDPTAENADTDKLFPLQLTDGNSDLYQNLKPDASSSVREDDKTYAQNEINDRSATAQLSGDDAYTYKDFRTDVIFYYWKEDSATVAPYVNAASAIASLEGVENWSTWAGDHGDDVCIEQVQADGSAISDLGYKEISSDGTEGDEVETIDPKYSERRQDYFVAGESYKRLEEDYAMIYKVRYGSTIYVTKRNARLTYRLGDVDLDGLVDAVDASRIETERGSQRNLIPTAGDNPLILTAQELQTNRQLGDLDHDGYIDAVDASVLETIRGAQIDFNQRW